MTMAITRVEAIVGLAMLAGACIGFYAGLTGNVVYLGLAALLLLILWSVDIAFNLTGFESRGQAILATRPMIYAGMACMWILFLIRF